MSNGSVDQHESGEDSPNSERLLAKYQGKRPPAPSWFEEAIARMPAPSFTDVEGASIEYLSWGAANQPGVLLLHGGRANAYWWAHLAPFLANDYYVVALSFSGMGNSSWRKRYSTLQYATEVRAVAEASGLLRDAPPVLVAHSFGAGPAASALAATWPTGAVIVDASVNTRAGRRERRFPPSRRVYPTQEAALARYRLIPPQHCANDFIVDGIARRSLRQVGNHWEWTYDPDWLTLTELADSRRDLLRASRPFGFIYGTHSSIVPESRLENLKRDFPRSAFVPIEGAGHHVMLDQPIMLAESIKRLIAGGLRPPEVEEREQ